MNPEDFYLNKSCEVPNNVEKTIDEINMIMCTDIYGLGAPACDNLYTPDKILDFYPDSGSSNKGRDIPTIELKLITINFDKLSRKFLGKVSVEATFKVASDNPSLLTIWTQKVSAGWNKGIGVQFTNELLKIRLEDKNWGNFKVLFKLADVTYDPSDHSITPSAKIELNFSGDITDRFNVPTGVKVTVKGKLSYSIRLS